MAQVYSSSRAFVPSALHSSVRVVENKVSELGSPLITAVQTRSEQVLTSLDRKVSSPPAVRARTSCMRRSPKPAVSQRLDAGLRQMLARGTHASWAACAPGGQCTDCSAQCAVLQGPGHCGGDQPPAACCQCGGCKRGQGSLPQEGRLLLLDPAQPLHPLGS